VDLHFRRYYEGIADDLRSKLGDAWEDIEYLAGVYLQWRKAIRKRKMATNALTYHPTGETEVNQAQKSAQYEQARREETDLANILASYDRGKIEQAKLLLKRRGDI